MHTHSKHFCSILPLQISCKGITTQENAVQSADYFTFSSTLQHQSHLLRKLFMIFKNTPWFSWLEEFPWCSAILKYTGRACTKHFIRIFVTLGHFSRPLNENKMLSTNEVNHLFRPLINYCLLRIITEAAVLATAPTAIRYTPWLCFAIAHPARCCSKRTGTKFSTCTRFVHTHVYSTATSAAKHPWSQITTTSWHRATTTSPSLKDPCVTITGNTVVLVNAYYVVITYGTM